ncbi:SIS domain-containing protein [Microbacterium aurantiacum]
MEYLPFATAIRRQPDELPRVIASINHSLDGQAIDPWLPGQTVAILAMGASTNSSHALTAALTSVGVRTTSQTPRELLAMPADCQAGDHYVVVSESGRSPEPLEFSARARTGARIGITNFPDQAIAGVVDTVISLGGVDDSAAYSIGYLGTLVAYSALLRRAGHPSVAIDEDGLPDLVQQVLARSLEAASAIAERFEAVSSTDFVGHSYSFSSAAEGALLFREALGLPGAAFDTYQYLHGPAESASGTSGVIFLGDGRELVLAEELARAGVPTLAVTAVADDRQNQLQESGVVILSVPAVEGIARAVAETVALHAVVEGIALKRRISIETFNYSQPDTKLQES